MSQRHTLQELASVTLQDPRWHAVAERDKAADGRFVYSVKSTGIYCRPSCSARLARPENVAFHKTVDDAERAGFRACKRCRPDEMSREEEQARLIAEACRTMESADEEPALQELADAANMSAFHFHRIFKKTLGVTPKQYAVAHREKTVRRKLMRSETVTNAIYDAGFNSSSRFYAKADDALGMTPSAFRMGGESVAMQIAVGESSLGCVLVAQSERGICAILLGDDPQRLEMNLREQFPNSTIASGDASFNELVAKVVSMIEHPGTELGVPLDIRGTAFQQKIWQALRQVPAGSTASYKDLAERVGLPKAVRAVASACAANTLAVAIPCHRVIRSDGGLSGYRWGAERKKALLEREAR